MLRDFLLAIFNNDTTFTLEDYEGLIDVLTEFYDQAEESRKEYVLDKITDGELPADAETKLQAYISTFQLSLPYQADVKAAELCKLSYPEFLASDYWAVVKAVVKTRAHGRCQLCSSRGPMHVHHKTYEHHGYEHAHLEDLICLCRSCHEKFHDKLPGVAGHA